MILKRGSFGSRFYMCWPSGVGRTSPYATAPGSGTAVV